MDKYVGDHEHRTEIFYKPLNLHSGFSMDPEDWEDIDNTVTENIPEWLTTKMSGDILYTIQKFRYAGLKDDDIIIWIPLAWVERRMRPYYREAKIFGVPLRLNEYITIPQVAIQVKERPPR